MLVKCSKCGYENQLNAIFCRGCGEKMSPAEITPEALAAEAEKRKKESRKINWWPIVGLVLLALALVYGIMLFTTPEGSPEYKVDESIDYKSPLKDIEKGYTVTVTPEQLTAYFNEHLIDKDVAKKGGNYVIKDVIFTGKGDLLTVTIHTTVLTCDTTLTIVGKLKKGPDSNPIQFEITDFSFGNTFLLFGRDALLKNFNVVFFAEANQEIFRKARDVSFADGQLMIIQNEKPVEPPPRKAPIAKPAKKK